MESHLQAGIAIYNHGQYHAAHDAWEERWLELDAGPDRRFLQGLIQFTAAVYHARTRNWSGTTGLADSARTYLGDLDTEYRGVNVGEVRRYLDSLERDPETIERHRPLRLTYRQTVLESGDLDLEATCLAATVLAEELGYDEEMIERAAGYARADLEAERTRSPFVNFLFDFVREPPNRGIIAQRLGEHVDRRRHRDEDVAGLFDDTRTK